MRSPQSPAEMRSDGPDPQLSQDRVRVRRLAAVMLGVAAVSNCWFVLALVLPATLPPGQTFISELAARGQPYATIFRIADLITGLSLISGVALGWLRAPVNRWIGAAGVALVGYGLLTATDSLLPLDCPPSWDAACRAAESAGTVSWQHQLHSLTGVLETLAILVACAGVTLGTRHSHKWWTLHRIASWIAVLQVTAALVISTLWLLDVNAIGWPQRIATLATSALLCAIGSTLARQEWDPSRPPCWPFADPATTRQFIVTVPVNLPSPANLQSAFPADKLPADTSGFPPADHQPDQLTVTVYQPTGHQPPGHQATGATALFLNGLSLPADLWQPVLAAAQPPIRAICFDRPGIGNSTGSLGPDLKDQLAQIRVVLAATVSATGDPAPVVVVAHSHSALAATTLARMHPELVSGLVLVDPSIPQTLNRAARATQAAAVALMGAGTRIRLVARIVGRGTTWLQLRSGLATPDCYWPPRQLRAQMAIQARLRAAVAELAIEAEDLQQEAAIASTLTLPPIPVAILAGGRVGWPGYYRDRRWAKRLSGYAEQLSAQVGNPVRFTALPGAHLLMLDAPDEVAQIVTELSQRIA